MFREWFEYSGRIDLGKITAYFAEVDAYDEGKNEWST